MNMRKWLVAGGARPSANDSQAHGQNHGLPHEEGEGGDARAVDTAAGGDALGPAAADECPAAATGTPAQLHQCVARELAAYETSDPTVKATVYKHHASLVAYNASEPPPTLFEASIVKGDLDGVHFLLNHHVKVEAQVRGYYGLLPLSIACEHGQLAVVKLLVDHGACVGGNYDSEGMPPLSVACRHGQFKVVKWLVDHNALEEDSNDSESDPLVEAVRYGDLQIVKYLLDAGASTYSKTGKSSDSVWCVAVREGRLRSIQCLTETRPDDLADNSRLLLEVLECALKNENLRMIRYLIGLGVLGSYEFRDCLNTVAGRGNIEMMKLFVSSGAKVNGWYGGDQSPLWNAIASNQLAATELLLSLGADVNMMTVRDGYSAIHMMVEYNRVEMLHAVHRICGNAADFNATTRLHVETPLHMAAYHGFPDVVRFLLEVAPNVNIRAESRSGRTPLAVAAGDGDIEIVRLLVRAGAPVNHQTSQQTPPPLCDAAASGKFYVVQFLCENGADVLWQSDSGTSALSMAASNGYADVVEYLAEAMGSHQDTAMYFSSALRGALNVANSEIVRVLLAHVGYRQCGEEDQQPDLMYQTMMNDIRRDVKLLLRNGADVNATRSFRITDVNLQLTPLLVAAGSGDLDLVKCLCENGADVEGVSDQNETALFFAAAYGELNVVRYLVSQRNANVESTTSYGYTPAEASFPAHQPLYLFLLSCGARRSSRDISSSRGNRSKMRHRRVGVENAHRRVSEACLTRTTALATFFDQGFRNRVYQRQVSVPL